MLNRFFMRLIPWWVFFLIGLFFGGLTIGTWQSYFAYSADIYAAETTTPPPPIPLAELDPATLSLDGEVEVIAHFSGVSGRIETGKVDHAYFLLTPMGDTGPSIAVIDLFILHDSMAEKINTRLRPDGTIQLRVFVSIAGTWRGQIEDALREAGVPYTLPLLVAEPAFGDRIEGLKSQRSKGRILAIIPTVACLACFFAGFTKLNAWRRRRKEGRPQETTVDGPIRSNKRGF
ncbi:hypothetical protein IV417_18940 [Alphaproteobacteria bacterium KMM 3653]|uniref:Uncharacterized protein n=1 Tax=Harenicola maris TaxID=2841044 RepID=A0AAP2G5Z2_9RHOB|nr:hypothetical protein [Harenicola maris]